MTPISILERARSLILQGWNQGSFSQIQSDGGIAFCLKGAVYQASNDLRRENDESIRLMALQSDEVIGALENVVKQHYPGFNSIVEFNDASERNRDEVVGVIDLALKGPNGHEEG